MVIDSHVHFGKAMEWDLKGEDLIRSFKKYSIDFGVVSNLEGAEFGHDLEKIENDKDQIEVNRKTLELVKKNPEKLKGLFWIKPYTNKYSEEVKDFLIENKEFFCGLKAHPYHSKMKFTTANYKQYIDLAKELKVPFAVHTAGDENSEVKYLYETAKENPEVKFIAVHMGLGTDNSEAIEYISNTENLYGDTTWVSKENVLEAVKKCGSNKILFGTDAIIDGTNTYEKYLDMFEFLHDKLTNEDFENIFRYNTKRIFKL